MKKVVFLGSDPIALPLLDYLKCGQGEFELAGIISQPDRHSGRGKKLQSNGIVAWAREHGTTLMQPDKPGPNEEAWFRENNIDLGLVMAYGHIIKDSFLNTPPLGMLNFHASLLPRYRGASPIETSLAMGDRLTGISLMRMVKKMDAGAILGQERVFIEPETDAAKLKQEMAEATRRLWIDYQNVVALQSQNETPQDETNLSYCRKLVKSDGMLDFNLHAKLIDKHIKAFNPWPGAFFEFKQSRLRVGSGYPVETTTHYTPGTIVKINHELGIACSENSIFMISELQRPGGRLLPTTDFLRGFPLPEGSLITFPQRYPLINHKYFKPPS